jgi:phthalate 4,5-dioxygenase
MLSVEDNEMITQCGPGTPMGNLMRQYWLPAIQSDELPTPDCPPLRIRLLNENLIAFRATSGKVGLIDDTCPHRGASMFFGRNEQEGLRCVYHGWKFDTAGQCTDMLNEPAGSSFPDRTRILAYPTHERGGIIWAYMGPRETPPPLPDLEANMMASAKPQVRTTMNFYNWMQSIENNMDTSHQAILHFGTLTPEVVDWPEFRDRQDVKYFVGDRAPIFDVRETLAGVSAGAHRPAEDDTYYWKTMHWFFPFYTMGPVVKLGSAAQFSATVPIDDYHCMSWGMTSVVGEMDGAVRGQNLARENLPNTSDWLGRFRNPASAHVATDFGLDREQQSVGKPSLQGWTGLIDVNTQDEAMRWSQGRANNKGVVDRSLEHLTQTDAQIIRVRKRLLDAAKALQEQGVVPPGVDAPHAYRYRSGWTILPRSVDFWEGARELREAFLKEVPVELKVEVQAAR